MYDAFNWVVDNEELFNELYGDQHNPSVKDFEENFERKCREVSSICSLVLCSASHQLY